jgi:hypothetical protein
VHVAYRWDDLEIGNVHRSSRLKAAALRVQFLRGTTIHPVTRACKRQQASTSASNSGRTHAPPQAITISPDVGPSASVKHKQPRRGSDLPQVSLAIERVLQRALEPLARGLLAGKLALGLGEVAL